MSPRPSTIPAAPGGAGRRRAVRRITAAAATAGALALSATAAHAQTFPGPAEAAPSTVVTVHDSSDTFISTGATQANYGESQTLLVGAGDTALLRFHLSDAEASRVVAAHLILTGVEALPETRVGVALAPGPWSAATVTAGTAPQLGTEIANTAVFANTSAVDLDVTAAAQTRTVSLAVTSSNSSDTIGFQSREATGDGPKLVLTLGQTGCSISTALVSSCQVWLGDAPQAYSNMPITAALATDESAAGRPFDIVHEYNTNARTFPGPAAIAAAASGRILSENWKPATDMTWAQVAAGYADDRVDAEAAYLKTHFDEPFFLTVWHEPENDVNPTPGSGMTTGDYVAMFRHVVLRLRADGATKFVSVMNYMGFSRWNAMRDALWPGDDVVDWIAWDPYLHHATGAAGHDFTQLVDPEPGTDFYSWASMNHPGTPLMLAEFGATGDTPDGQADFFRSVTRELPGYPALRAVDYFNISPVARTSSLGEEFQNSAAGLAAFRTMAGTSPLIGPGIAYSNGGLTLSP